MAYVTVQDVNIATGASAFDPINVEGFDRVSLDIQTFAVYCLTASVALSLQGSTTATTSSFRYVKHMGVYSAGSGILNWEVPVGVGNYVVTCEPATNFKWIRPVLLANTATASANVKVILVRNT